MRCEFLPPYSPDYNPIELAFSAMKYNLRRKGEYVRFAMTELSEVDIHFSLIQALCQITPADVFGWFRHCGYV
jgi:transposase